MKTEVVPNTTNKNKVNSEDVVVNMKHEEWIELSMAQKQFQAGQITKEAYDKLRVKHGIPKLEPINVDGNPLYIPDNISQRWELEKNDPRKMIEHELHKDIHRQKIFKVFFAVMQAIHDVSWQGMTHLRTDISVKFDGKHMSLIKVMLMLRNGWKTVDDYQLKYAYNKIVREVVATTLIKINDEILQELEV